MKPETEKLIDDTKREYLPKKERDIMLFNIRKIVSDLDTLLLYIDSYSKQFTASDNNRIRQYIKNNQTRAKSILWQLTSLSFKRGKQNERKNNNKRIDKSKTKKNVKKI